MWISTSFDHHPKYLMRQDSKYIITKHSKRVYSMSHIPSPTTAKVLSKPLAASRLGPALDIEILLTNTEEPVAYPIVSKSPHSRDR